MDIASNNPVKSSKQMEQLIEEYKCRLTSNPSLRLKSVSDELGYNYRKVIDWTTSHGVFVRALQAEARGESQSNKSSTFIQFTPARVHTNASCPLKGISITFPDGVNLTLQESSVESVISLLTIYQARRGGASVCSD